MSDTAARRLMVVFQAISEAIEAAQDDLSELDGAIGDADHGITMTLGFHRVAAELSQPGRALATASAVMTVAATAFLDAAGASTGPLYASAFRRAAERLTGVEAWDTRAATVLLGSLADGIAERGKGQRGDKTMLDAWIPAAEAASQAVADGLAEPDFWRAVVAAGEQGADATRSMVAVRGRAARMGQRSLGHVDPGAASAVIILKAMAEAFAEADRAAAG